LTGCIVLIQHLNHHLTSKPQQLQSASPVLAGWCSHNSMRCSHYIADLAVRGKSQSKSRSRPSANKTLFLTPL
jgi:hypothetical protein